MAAEPARQRSAAVAGRAVTRPTLLGELLCPATNAVPEQQAACDSARGRADATVPTGER